MQSPCSSHPAHRAHILPNAKLCHAADFFGNDVQMVRHSFVEQYIGAFLSVSECWPSHPQYTDKQKLTRSENQSCKLAECQLLNRVHMVCRKISFFIKEECVASCLEAFQNLRLVSNRKINKCHKPP